MAPRLPLALAAALALCERTDAQPAEGFPRWRRWMAGGKHGGGKRAGRGRGRGGGARAADAIAREAEAGVATRGAAHAGRLHVIPEGGSLAVECAAGTVIEAVSFASFGTPQTSANGSVAIDPTCHSRASERVLRDACVGESHCCFPVSTDNFGPDPCHGKIKTLAVVLHGCDEHAAPTRWKRHCSLQGQWLLCDEDIEFLSALELPERAESELRPHVAVMVDTSYRPRIQHFVVHNVRNNTGWPVQLFHGPSNGPKLKELFHDLVEQGELTLTNLKEDYMEDWQRLSSMMLLDTFWKATIGRKVLIFQPDSIMCAAATMSIRDFVQYDYVGPPMAGPYWMTSDHNSQWGVGCGGFSLRDRAKAILMCNTPRCVTPAAGKLEDQQLGVGWKHIEKRCAEAGIVVHKPNRHLAARFGMEYDLYMDVLPGEDPAMPDGCRAKFHTCAKYDPGMWRRPPHLRIPKWNPEPKPANVQCERPHYVPMACHKCWHWNHRTWNKMTKFCPEVTTMRELRALYKVGVEFTGWPTRPRPSPVKGKVLPDPRWLPIDMLQGQCKGKCEQGKIKSGYARTTLGKYHK